MSKLSGLQLYIKGQNYSTKLLSTASTLSPEPFLFPNKSSITDWRWFSLFFFQILDYFVYFHPRKKKKRGTSAPPGWCGLDVKQLKWGGGCQPPRPDTIRVGSYLETLGRKDLDIFLITYDLRCSDPILVHIVFSKHSLIKKLYSEKNTKSFEN